MLCFCLFVDRSPVIYSTILRFCQKHRRVRFVNDNIFMTKLRIRMRMYNTNYIRIVPLTMQKERKKIKREKRTHINAYILLRGYLQGRKKNGV